MLSKHPLRQLSLCLGIIATFAWTASAQTAVIEEVSAFKAPFVVVQGAIAQLPDGRVYGFYTGGLHGAIYQVLPNGRGGYSNVVVYEYGPTQAGPATPTNINGSGGNVAAGGADGWIYYVGQSLSRFNPDTGVVQDLTGALNAQPTQLSMGIDGHTLFGSFFDGRIFRYDTTTSTFNIVTTIRSPLVGMMQMKDGNLVAVTNPQNSPFAAVIHRLDPLTGVETGAIVQPNSFGYAPAKGDDGEIYAQTNVFGDRTFFRVDTACFCRQIVYVLPHVAPFVSSVTGARNGYLYLDVNAQPHRINLTTTPATLERLATQSGYYYRLLLDGTLLLSADNQVFALNTNTAMPDASPTLLFAAGMDNDGTDGFPSQYTLGADRMLYGITDSPREQFASIFRIDPDTRSRALVGRLDVGPLAADGAISVDKMVLAPDGRLFGTMHSGYTAAGAIFSFDPPANRVEIIKNYLPVDPNTGEPAAGGSYPQRLTLGSDGWIYGVTLFDSDYYSSSIFKIDPATNAVVTAARHTDPDHGFNMLGRIVEVSPGVWLGNYFQQNATDSDICERLFRFDASTGAFTMLKNFYYETDGCGTIALVRSPDGRVFGSTSYGGAPDNGNAGDWPSGNLFAIDPNTGNTTKLVQFRASMEIAAPYGDLLIGADGLLYSTYMKYVQPSLGYAKGLFRVDPDNGATTHLAMLPGLGGYLGAGTLFGHDGRVLAGTLAPHRLYAFGVDAIHVAPASGPFGGSTSFSARLTSAGVSMAGRTITFTRNGVAVGSAITDAGGVATITNVSLSGIAVGAHAAAINASFAGDDQFPAASASGLLTVIAPPPPTVPQLLERLLALVNAVDPSYGLHAFVGQAQQAYAANRSADACAALSKLQAQVDRKATKSGKVKLTTAEASAITAANAAVRTALGCS